MNNLDIMQSFQTPRSLYEDFPYVVLIYQLVILLMLLDELEHIAAVSILHHDTRIMKGRRESLPKVPTGLIEEGLLVRDDVRVSDGCEDSHLVEGVLFLLESQVVDVDFLHGILLPICQSFHFVDTGVGSGT